MRKIFILFFFSLLFFGCQGIHVREDSAVRFSGTVLDMTTGKPVKGASVEIKNADMGVGYYLAESDRSGSFEIENFIPYIMYNVKVEAEGYVSFSSSEVLTSDSRKFFLSREASVSGIVSDSSGRPVAGADVTIEPDMYSGVDADPVIVSTDAEGKYVFKKLAQAPWTVTVSSPGFITEKYSIQTLRPGESFKLPVTLYRPASVSGTLLIKGDMTPVTGADVFASGRGNHSAVTWEDGSFRLEDMKPGNYEIEIQHQGFDSPEKKTVTLKEGEKINNVSFRLNVKAPDVQVSSYRYTYAPGNTLSFNLRTFRLESVTVTVYQVPVSAFISQQENTLSSGTKGFKKKLSWTEPVQDFDPYQWRYQELTVKDPLPAGGYCLEVKGADKVQDRKFFTVTSAGSVVKRSSSEIFTYVTDLVKNTPVEGASVAVFENLPVKDEESDCSYYKDADRIEDLPVKILARGKTDRDGVFKTKVSSPHNLIVLTAVPDESYSICNSGSAAYFKKEQKKYFIHTDRPVYRSGDSVSFKITGKNREKLFVPQAGEKVYHRIVNRTKGSVLTEGWLNLDEWGTVSGSFKAEEATGLGTWAVEAGPDADDTYDACTFYVEQYRKPEYSVDLVPDRESYINGDTLEFKVESRYFFGTPVKNGLLRFRFYEKKINESGNYWQDERSASASYSRLKLEGSRYLNDSGIVSLKLDSGNLPYDREITLEASVTDRANVTITERKTVRVGRGEFFLKITSEDSFFKTSEKKPVTVKAETFSGKPVRADVKLEVFRYIWKPYQRIYVHDIRPCFSENITTDSSGSASVSIPGNFTSAGEYDIVVTSSDRRKNIITASSVVWVYDPSGSGQADSRFRNLELSVDKKEQKSPGKITCLIKSRYTDGYACITVEGRNVYTHKVVKLKGNITPVELTSQSSWAPDFYVSAVMQRQRALYTAMERISVPASGTDLKLTMKPEKEKYAPGDTVKLDVTAVDEKGNPVSADISLSVVDESVYKVRRDRVPAMKDFFYGKMSNQVLTSYSYPVTLLAGASKDGKEGIRQDFRDTAFWKADVRTGESGKITVSFKVPDNLTAWRITARGHDKTGRVGEKLEKFTVTKDLIAGISRPAFLVEGDSISFLGTVTSNTDRGFTKIETEMKADGTVIPGKTDTFSLPPFAAEKTAYPVTVPEENFMELQFRASGSGFSDAVKYTVPVQKRGPACTLLASGNLSSAGTVKLVPSSGDFDFIPEKISAAVSPGPVPDLLRASDYLLKYPYACTEQTVSGFIPSYILNGLLNKNSLGFMISPESSKKLADKTQSSLRRLESLQNGNGTWGWWAGGSGSAFLTAWVMEALWRAEKAGMTVPKTAVKEGLSALNVFLNDGSPDSPEYACVFMVNSLYGKFDSSAFKKISSQKKITPFTAACLVRALSEGKTSLDRETVQKHISVFLKIISGSVKQDSKGIYWEGEGGTGGWPGSCTDVTAAVLMALSKSGKEPALAAGAAESLMNRGRAEGWCYTKTSALVIFALCDHMERTSVPAGEKCSVSFAWGSEKLGTIEYNPAEKVKTSSLTLNKKLSGKVPVKELEITASGTGGAAAFTVAAEGYLKFRPEGILSPFKKENRSLSAMSRGISLTRSCSTLSRVKDGQGREYLVPCPADEDTVLHSGDEILIRLRFRPEKDMEYLILEDFLPSGFRVVKENAYASEGGPCRCEKHDEKMVYFFTGVKKDREYEAAYTIRAELEGNFLARPAVIKCMYDSSVQGWSEPAVFDVKN